MMFERIVFFDLVVITIGIVGWALYLIQHHKDKLLKEAHRTELNRSTSVFETETTRLNAALYVHQKIQMLLCSEPDAYEESVSRQPMAIGLEVADRLRSLGLEFKNLDIDPKFFGDVVDEAQASFDEYRREKHVRAAQAQLDMLVMNGSVDDPDAVAREIRSQLDTVRATFADLEIHRGLPLTEEDLASLVAGNHVRIAMALWYELNNGAVDMDAIRSHVAKIKKHAVAGGAVMTDIAGEAELAEAIQRCVMKSLQEPAIETLSLPQAEV